MLVKERESKNEVIRVVFLYFFQMCGIAKDDEKTLSTLFDFVQKTNSNAGKPKEMTVAQQDSLKFNVDQAMIFGQGKQAQIHLRHFKKFCKLFVANLVDIYPARSELLVEITREVCNLARFRIRLVRYAFTLIGMQIMKNLLN